MAAERSVLVTGIGGNVGQGALRILRSLGLPLRLIGTNTTSLSGGNHLCDAVHTTPFATDPGYLERIRAVCGDERIELVLPCTDYEAYHLAAAGALPTVVTSSPETQRAFLDKLTTFERCAAAGVPFASSVLPSAYADQFAGTVVKPREGRGSRDVHLDPLDPSGFDDGFVVQERLVGQEITVAFYVRRDGAVHGFVAFERELGAGATMLCTLTRAHDVALRPMIEAFVDTFAIRGSCNLQAIVREGDIVPFEVNGRISGTASIRHRLGFRDVEYAVREYLLDTALPAVELQPGTAVRLLMDVIYPGATPSEARDRSSPHELF